MAKFANGLGPVQHVRGQNLATRYEVDHAALPGAFLAWDLNKKNSLMIKAFSLFLFCRRRHCKVFLQRNVLSGETILTAHSLLTRTSVGTHWHPAHTSIHYTQFTTSLNGR